MPQSVGWQFIGHIVRTICEGEWLTIDAFLFGTENGFDHVISKTQFDPGTQFDHQAQLP
jgi:hypothetical protein